jgi:HSP20 family protein
MSVCSSIGSPSGGKPVMGSRGRRVSREYALVNFFRQFELSENVDQSQITAELKNGVLTVTLPKAEEAKPRQIVVQAA